MYINKLLKKQLILSLATFGIIGLIAVSTSYALFQTTKSNPVDQTLTVGSLVINYTGGTAISINPIEPMTDTEGLNATNNTYTLTVNNTGTVAYSYDLSLEDNPEYLSGGSSYISTRTLLNHSYIKYTLNGGTPNVLGEKTNGKINTGVINPGATKTFTIKLWVKQASELPNEAIGAEIHLSIVVDGRASAKETLKDIILGANNLNVTSAQTTPGQAISSSSEAVLASTPDDYGTSYYYRGAVENNYVSFAGMCWRVVRVTGNGAIKLVLYNYNPTSVANPCDSTQDGTTNAFARYSGDTYTTAFNANYNQNAYIGFMYGTAGSSSYAAEHANTNKSTILTNLEAWYNAKLASYSSKLADTIWCNDKSIAKNDVLGTILGYGTNQTGYKSRERLYPVVSAQPSLICPNDDNGGNLSKFTADDAAYGNASLDYKIGLLTADEVAFAGGIVGVDNNSYLNKNASNNDSWTLSASAFEGVYAVVWSMHSTGQIGDYAVNGSYALRPAVSLISSTTATGTGTQSDPFVIE